MNQPQAIFKALAIVLILTQYVNAQTNLHQHMGIGHPKHAIHHSAPTIKKSNAAAQRVSAIKTVPTEAKLYDWDSATITWNLVKVGKYIYDEAGRVTSELTFDPSMDSVDATYTNYDARGNVISLVTKHSDGTGGLGNTSKTIFSYDGKGNNTEQISSKWDDNAWIFDFGSKIIYTYDGLGRVMETIIQTYDQPPNTVSNIEKLNYTYTGTSHLYTTVEKYQYPNGTWVKTYEMKDIVWRNFDKKDVLSGNEYEYENNLLLYSGRLISAASPTETVYRYEEAIDGNWILKKQVSEFFDSKGESAGTRVEQFENGIRSGFFHGIITNTYNANDEKIEEIYTIDPNDPNPTRHKITYSNFINPSITAINKTGDAASQALFPNPAQNEIYLLNNLKQTTIAMYTPANQLVFKIELAAGQENIDVSTLKAGIYFVTAQSQSEGQKTFKLVKN